MRSSSSLGILTFRGSGRRVVIVSAFCSATGHTVNTNFLLFFLPNVAAQRYESGMRKKSTSVRVDSETVERLKNLSEMTGLSVTRLITLATSRYADMIEDQDRIEIPLRRVAEQRASYGRGKYSAASLQGRKTSTR